MEFEIGDLVVLKSGGPIMTIKSIIDESKVMTVWFNDERSEFVHDSFDIRTIDFSCGGAGEESKIS